MYRGMQSLCHAYVLHDFILSFYYVELHAKRCRNKRASEQLYSKDLNICKNRIKFTARFVSLLNIFSAI